MASSIVQGLADWCERSGDSLRSLGIALEHSVAADASRSSARALLEARGAFWEVLVWDHGGMCDVSRASAPSGDMAYRHYGRLDPEGLATLMAELVAEAKALIGHTDPEQGSRPRPARS